MDQVVIIVIIGLISLVNWLMKRSSELREQQKLDRRRDGVSEDEPFHQESQASGTSRPRPAAETPADMRRLMDALGLQIDEEPVVAGVPAPHPPLPAFRPPPLPLPRVQKSAAPTRAPAPVGPVNPLSAVLRSRDGIRQAIVLREILGPPKAFTLQHGI